MRVQEQGHWMFPHFVNGIRTPFFVGREGIAHVDDSHYLLAPYWGSFHLGYVISNFVAAARSSHKLRLVNITGDEGCVFRVCPQQ